jgi:hypothetical protein
MREGRLLGLEGNEPRRSSCTQTLPITVRGLPHMALGSENL